MVDYQSIQISDQIVDFYSYKQIFHSHPEELQQETKELYETLFFHATYLSNLLKIPCPYIGLTPRMRRHSQTDNSVSVQNAICYTPQDIPSLDNNVILLSMENSDFKTILGYLAHELRHIWQNQYSDLNLHPADGFIESLTHPAEIDADGYAIWYLSNRTKLSLEDAAALICPEEQKHYQKEFQQRLEKASYFKQIRPSLMKKLKITLNLLSGRNL